MAVRKIRDEADARACLTAARKTHGSRVAWARANGVDARSLNAWRVALMRRGKKKGRPSPAAASARLVELVPRGPLLPARYVLEMGVARIEFDDGFSAETLLRAVRAVRAC
jgi:hypothetical protein